MKLSLGIITLSLLLSAGVSSADGSRTRSSMWVNDMDHVLGDVKQGLITNAISTTAQADNIIDGFKAMKVDGIRIPIFAEGRTPNKPIFDYFYQRAVAEGFLIFANPAQSSGGQRIACGILNGSVCQNNNTHTQVLIDRIKDFAEEYRCDWINPFNEDGRPGAPWTAAQMNTIYSSLEDNLNGADLIGPGVWGIPASIEVLQQTNIESHITVATTHNLGFNHGEWPTFQALADQSNLPVWDSEVTNTDRGNGTRLDAALNANVDGLVLYNSWNTISKTNGSISEGGQSVMNKFLKFQTDKTYYIDNVATNRRIASNGNSESPYTTEIGATGPDMEWKFVDNGNGLYHLDRAAGGSKPRLRSDNTALADMQATSSSGGWTAYEISQSATSGNYYFTLRYGPSNHRRLEVDSSGSLNMVTTRSSGDRTRFTFTEVR